MLEQIRAYREEFGIAPPTKYFNSEEAFIDAVEEALERGDPYTEREWLQAAGYSPDQIEDVLSGDMLI